MAAKSGTTVTSTGPQLCVIGRPLDRDQFLVVPFDLDESPKPPARQARGSHHPLISGCFAAS
ncbi:hypothetical protein SM007_37745 [Streptomyces avermitilis]|nr:hypothetical protein SM007_37745 [Streptomyces avermitilis]